MSDYTQCHICGHTIPQGHPCLNCVKSNRMKETDSVVTPEQISKHVEIMTLKKDDILVLRNIDLEDTEHVYEFLKNMKTIKDNNVSVIVLEKKDSDFLIIRGEDDK